MAAAMAPAANSMVPAMAAAKSMAAAKDVEATGCAARWTVAVPAIQK